MKIRENDKQIIMEYTTIKKRIYITGGNKYDIAYSVRLESIENLEMNYNLVNKFVSDKLYNLESFLKHYFN